MNEKNIEKKAKKLYENTEQQEAYIKGFLDCQAEYNKPENKNLFDEMAKALRELWPRGEKEGGYPWRDSVNTIARRIEFIFNERKIPINKYSVSDVASAGARYLSNFASKSTKYMQTLKYFVFRQEPIKIETKTKYTYKSTLCDYLEDSVQQILKEEWETAMNSSPELFQDNTRLI